MKTTLHSLWGLFCMSLAFVSCQKDFKELPETANENLHYGKIGMSTIGLPESQPYVITLEEFNVPVGNLFRWTWKVVNSNPGATQGLSHWGFPTPNLNACFGVSNVSSASYSANGTSWISFTPSIGPDPSQDCVTGPVFKFDFGTNEGAPSYYRLFLTQPYAVNMQTGYFKSGKKNPCGPVSFPGIACTGQIIINGVFNFGD